ncbi:hypothetical protein ACVWZR_008699 [Bradyrhizobium sp. i1.3.1]
MTKHEITFSNRAYSERWHKNLKRQNGAHFDILTEIIVEIEAKDGGDISKADIFERNPQIRQRIAELDFDIIPSRGQLLRHNGNGIRHAKYAPSKSVAVIWEKIRDTIYITFDDHAPIRYHRAIAHLRDLRLGRPVFAKRARTTGRFMKILKRHWRQRADRALKGISLSDRYYE